MEVDSKDMDKNCGMTHSHSTCHTVKSKEIDVFYPIILSFFFWKNLIENEHNFPLS